MKMRDRGLKGVDGVFSNKLIQFLHQHMYKSTGFLISESLLTLFER